MPTKQPASQANCDDQLADFAEQFSFMKKKMSELEENEIRLKAKIAQLEETIEQAHSSYDELLSSYNAQRKENRELKANQPDPQAPGSLASEIAKVLSRIDALDSKVSYQMFCFNKYLKN